MLPRNHIADDCSERVIAGVVPAEGLPAVSVPCAERRVEATDMVRAHDVTFAFRGLPPPRLVWVSASGWCCRGREE